MYIGAEVDDDEVFGKMMEYILGKIPTKSKIVIVKELLDNLSWNILRDRIYLAIHYNNDKELIPLLKNYMEKEKGSVMKRNMQKMIDKMETT